MLAEDDIVTYSFELPGMSRRDCRPIGPIAIELPRVRTAAGVAGLGRVKRNEPAMSSPEDKVQPGVHQEHDSDDGPL